ncbi:MAG: hypothetical protein IPJ34_19320 [Myxococcales bacterium]|nr:hypothetical protein [Myxococcales bacterium]
MPSDASSIPSPFTIPEGPWTFPPQAEKDRFIARDLAIYTLANLALTDLAQPTNDMGPDMNGGSFAKSVCSEAYARAAADAKYAKRNRKFLFDLDLPLGAEEADDLLLKADKFNLSQKVELTDARARNVGAFRLLMDAHILRASGGCRRISSASRSRRIWQAPSAGERAPPIRVVATSPVGAERDGAGRR